MPVGTHDYAFLDFPESLPADRAAGMSTASGVPFASILRAASAAMGSITQNISPTAAALTVQTDQEDAGETFSNPFVVEYSREYSVALPQRGDKISHLLPVRKMDAATQFTEEFLDNVTDRQIAVSLDGLSNAFRRVPLTASLGVLFNPAAVPVNENSTTMSPKFIGYDTADPAYGRVSLADGTLVASPYTHYQRVDTAGLLAGIDAAIVKLQARGETGPFDIFPSPNAATAIAGLAEFISAGDAFVRPAMGDAEAMVDPNVYIGVLRGRDVRVRKPISEIIDDTTNGTFALVKTYGANAAGNPIAWRFLPKYGLTPILRSRSLYPLEYATVIARWGFGVNNRFGAVLTRIAAAGAYVAPQIRA
ncbi:MAG: hypothetical protein M3440_06195 [Chloroflexota bacterium]|nr:hypothetical protein [Chloroflexota bacterium]